MGAAVSAASRDAVSRPRSSPCLNAAGTTSPRPGSRPEPHVLRQGGFRRLPLRARSFPRAPEAQPTRGVPPRLRKRRRHHPDTLARALHGALPRQAPIQTLRARRRPEDFFRPRRRPRVPGRTRRTGSRPSTSSLPARFRTNAKSHSDADRDPGTGTRSPGTGTRSRRDGDAFGDASRPPSADASRPPSADASRPPSSDVPRALSRRRLDASGAPTAYDDQSGKTRWRAYVREEERKITEFAAEGRRDSDGAGGRWRRGLPPPSMHVMRNVE